MSRINKKVIAKKKKNMYLGKPQNNFFLVKELFLKLEKNIEKKSG